MYASGKYAKSVCDRCGFAFKYLDIVSESGTSWRVCFTCNDGQFSLVSHPQNYPPKKLDENIGLEHPRPDVSLALDWDEQDLDNTEMPFQIGGRRTG